MYIDSLYCILNKQKDKLNIIYHRLNNQKLNIQYIPYHFHILNIKINNFNNVRYYQDIYHQDKLGIIVFLNKFCIHFNKLHMFHHTSIYLHYKYRNYTHQSRFNIVAYNLNKFNFRNNILNHIKKHTNQINSNLVLACMQYNFNYFNMFSI